MNLPDNLTPSEYRNFIGPHLPMSEAEAEVFWAEVIAEGVREKQAMDAEAEARRRKRMNLPDNRSDPFDNANRQGKRPGLGQGTIPDTGTFAMFQDASPAQPALETLQLLRAMRAQNDVIEAKLDAILQVLRVTSTYGTGGP